MKTLQRGETIGLWAYVKDWAGSYQSPDNGVRITLTDPNGVVKVDNQLMTEDATGRFVYYYTSVIADAIGWWRFRCRSQDGTGDAAKYTITDGGFKLE